MTREQVEKRISFLKAEVEEGRVNPAAADLEIENLKKSLREMEKLEQSRTPAGRRRTWMVAAVILMVFGGVALLWRTAYVGPYEAGITGGNIGSGFFDVEIVQCNEDGTPNIEALTPVVVRYGDGVVPAAFDACEEELEYEEGLAGGFLVIGIGAFALAAGALLRAWTISDD